MDWINCRDEMPQEGVEVLVYSSYKGRNNTWIASYFGNTFDEDCWIKKGSRAGSLTHVTHWMPLPEPPKDTRKNLLHY